MFDQQQTNGILTSEAHLTTEYTPDRPVGRDGELDRIGDALRPLTRNRSAENLLIHGPAGVGKTTCVKHVFGQLEYETNVKTVHLNCWQYNTRPSFITRLLVKLGYPAPRKGKPVDELVSKLREWIDRNRSVAVALDEFDQLRDATEVIYDLRQVSQEAENNLGILMVSNRHPTGIQLDPRSDSRLTCGTVEFRPYTASELEAILAERAEEAFRSGAIHDEVVSSIAARVADQSGDCREALELLLRAGRYADRQDASKVTEDHVAAIRDE